MTKIFSWNILFRKYEELYNPKSSGILKKYPIEIDRINAILSFLLENMEEDMVFCLQEVSYDIICRLNTIFRHKYDLFSQPKKDDFMVTLTPKNMMMVKDHRSTNNYLITCNKDICIVNCHLKPLRFSKNNMMCDFLEIHGYNNIFVAGDFNETQNNVKTSLGNNFICPYYGKTYKNIGIDHIVFKTTSLDYSIGLVKNDFISDHCAITFNSG